MESFLQLDTQLSLFVNGCHSSLADQFFYLYSKTNVWIPFYIAYILLFIKKLGKNSLWVVIGLVIAVIVSDQISSSFFKPLVERFRPSHEPSLVGQIHIVNEYVGGLYGFVSSHAANTSAIALFLILLLRNNWHSVILLSWTLLSSYSRVYLGVHYVGDVVCGTIVGLLSAWLVFKLYIRNKGKFEPSSLKYDSKNKYEIFINLYTPLVVYLATIVVMFIISVG